MNGKIYADVVGGIGVVDICLIDNTDLYLTDDIFEELSSWCKCMILSRHDLSGIMAREEIELYLVRPSDDGFLFREVINELGDNAVTLLLTLTEGNVFYSDANVMLEKPDVDIMINGVHCTCCDEIEWRLEEIGRELLGCEEAMDEKIGV